MSPFEPIQIERNGRVWQLHWRRRYDPITLGLAAAGVGTGVGIAGTLKEGRQAEKIAERRAAIDIEQSKRVREASVEEARIRQERGQRVLATQKSQAAAGGIRLNVGVPLVIAAQTRADIAKDIGFGLERGRVEEEALISRAGIEIATGKAAKKRSKFSALSQGLTGFGSLGLKGREAGIF